MNRTHVPLRSASADVLAVRAAAGDSRAAIDLCARFAGLVRAYARTPAIGWDLRDDLEQEGRLALLEAARSFDPQRGVPFTAWAAGIVRARISDAAARLRTPGGVPMRLPRHIWRQLAQQREGTRRQQERLDRIASLRAVPARHCDALVGAPDPADTVQRRVDDLRVMRSLRRLPKADREAIAVSVLGLPGRPPTSAQRRRALDRLAVQVRARRIH